MALIQEDTPELVVGIDFGMTYTGVAWTNLANSTQSIKDWPGLGDSRESKVPTKIVYGHHNMAARWGFLCEDENGEEIDDVFECFKIYLDQDRINAARQNGVRDMPNNIEEAKRLITDYLHQIYLHTRRSIESNTGGSWVHKRVEFIFSTPTTWQTLDITTEFERAIRAAGFGSEPNHSAKLELTEAEAAAVYVATNPQVTFVNGEVLLICDAGGGTTDLGLVEIVDANPQRPALKQVAAVSGVGIGSTMIDRAFQNLVQKRLNNNPDVQARLPRNLALKLARSTAFRSVKHNFGTLGGDLLEYKFALDRLGIGISQDFNHPGLRVERGRMQFTRTEIQSLFDTQIRGIIRRIDEQLEWMRINRSADIVKYLVLSGGLGGSPYVKSKLEQKYTMANPGLHIIRSQEPRLSVVHGLVMDRRQKLMYGTAAITTRIARASYGVLCRERYNPVKHVGADVEVDYYEKSQKWATNQIDWLIRKGDAIDTNTARQRPFTKKINPGDPSRQWDTTIIISHNDIHFLPRMMKQSGAHKLCVVKADLKEVAQIEFEEKNKRCWQGKRYFLATFTVRVIIAPADLKFELWFKGAKYNRSHDPVTIQWDNAGASVRPTSINKEADDNWESCSGRPEPGRFRSMS